MAYFPNGTSGDIYMDEWCFRCQHWQADETKGCPIWDLHSLYNYSQCGNNFIKSILRRFIPMKEGFADKCKMFLSNGDVKDQMKLSFMEQVGS